MLLSWAFNIVVKRISSFAPYAVAPKEAKLHVSRIRIPLARSRLKMLAKSVFGEKSIWFISNNLHCKLS